MNNHLYQINNLIEDNTFTPEQIFNSDQSKIEYEMMNKRAYANKGTKNVKRRADNVNSTTHTYTIQVSCFYLFYIF